MTTHFRTWNEMATTLVLEELTRLGLDTLFLAPGSRSSPLVLAAAQNSRIQIHTHFDERGLGFAALGYAKATQKPVAIVTTSGSAVANLLPAVVEAFQSQTPLLLLTADRPFELLENGANQAIAQNQIFSAFSCFLDIPEVSEKSPMTALLSKVSHAFQDSQVRKRPLHINWHFQEPLIPLKQETVVFPENLKTWSSSSRAWTSVPSRPQVVSQIPDDLFAKKRRGIICAGAFLSLPEQNTILKIAEKLKMPLLWDVQNTHRFQVHHQNICNFDLVLDKITPDADLILHFGGSLTSKRLNQWMEASPATYVRVYPESDNKDFLNLSKTWIQTSYENFLQQLQGPMSLPPEPSPLLQILKEHSQQIESFFEAQFANELSEMNLPYHFLNHTRDCNLFVGSSMPIRDLERFGVTGNVRIFSNRGASGIDGNVATAIGVSLATQMPTVAFVGDLTFLYDLNSLAMVPALETPFKILVVNNQGGGIFSFLPAAQIEASTFQKYFHTPHGWTFEKAAEFFQLKYFKIETPSDLKKALHYNSHALIEFVSSTPDNVAAHRALTEAYKKL